MNPNRVSMPYGIFRNNGDYQEKNIAETADKMTIICYNGISIIEEKQYE